MAADCLYASPRLRARLRGTATTAVARLHVAVHAPPDCDDVRGLTREAVAWLDTHGASIMLHVQHCGPGNLEVPAAPVLVCIVGCLLGHGARIADRLVGTVVQTEFVDDRVREAEAFLRSLYTPRRPFHLVAGEDAAAASVAALTRPRPPPPPRGPPRAAAGGARRARRRCTGPR